MSTAKWAMIAIGLMCASDAGAASVAMTNAGFEALYQGSDVLTGSFPTGGPPSGWTRYDSNGTPVADSLLGVLNPGTQADYDSDGAGLSPCFPAGAPEGDNVALLFKSGGAAAAEYGIEQQLSTLLDANVEYTLAVEVDNIQTCAGLPPGFRTTFNLDGFPGYRIELWAGQHLLATDADSLLPAEGTFEPSSISFSAAPGHPALGQPLRVRLISLNRAGSGSNLEVDFDDVRLDAVAMAPTPLPRWSLWGLGLLLALTAGLVARRRGAERTIRPLVLLAVGAGCGGGTPAAPPTTPEQTTSPAAPDEQLTIPLDLRDEVARSIAVGRELYLLDKAAAIGTDVLFTNVKDHANAGLAGYLPFHAGENGKPTQSFLVMFYTAEEPPRVAYEVRVGPNAPATFQSFAPPKEAPAGFDALVRARQLSIRALPAIEQPLNPVVIPAGAVGEQGFLVYLLAGTKRPDLAVLGKHYRAIVPLDTSRVSSLQALSNTIIEIPTLDPNGQRVVSLMVTHVVTDYPLETHVFTSLLHALPLTVMTRRGIWTVDGDVVSFRGGLPR